MPVGIKFKNRPGELRSGIYNRGYKVRKPARVVSKQTTNFLMMRKFGLTRSWSSNDAAIDRALNVAM
jgi:hypothetical protein